MSAVICCIAFIRRGDMREVISCTQRDAFSCLLLLIPQADEVQLALVPFFLPFRRRIILVNILVHF